MNCQEIFTHSELRLAEDDLSVGLAIFLGKLGEYRLIQQTAVTVTSDGKTLVQGTDYTVSYSDNTNAGTATVTATGTGIYSDMVTKSFEIAPKEITAALTGTTSKTYDGTMNPPTGLSLTLDGVIDGDDVTVSAGSIAYNSAGVQTADTITASGITLAGAAKDNYRLVSDTVSVAGTITKSQPTIAFSSSYAPDKAYDGQEIGYPRASDLTVTGAAFADVEFTWSATPQNAGTYDGTTSASVTAEVKTGLLTGDSITITGVTGAFANANAGAGKTVTVDSSGASTSGANADKYQINFPASTTASIEKADASVTTAPAARPLAYTGEAQALVSAGTASVGEVVYSLTETGPYSTAIPSGVNAGSYEVWYKIADTDNYNGATPLKVAAAISKVNYTGEKAGSTSGKFGVEKTYDLKALLPQGYVLGTPTVTDNDGIFSGVPTVSGTELHYTLADAAGNTGRSITITVPVTSSTNYEPFDLKITVTVLDKFAVTLEVPDITIVYGQTPKISGTAAGGDGAANLAGEWEFVGEIPADVPGGAVTVRFTPADTENYQTPPEEEIQLTITAVPLSGTPAFDTITSSGKTLADVTLTAPSNWPAGTFAWGDGNGTAVEQGKAYGYTFTPESGNYQPYTGSATPWAKPVDPPTPTVIPVAGVRLNRSLLTLEPGGSFHFTATVEPSNTTQSKAVTWSSSNPAVADVDGSGTILARIPGTAVITVRTVSGGKTAACIITVEAPEPETYTITYNANGGAGVPNAVVTLMRGTQALAAERTDSNGRFTFTGVPVGIYNLKAEKGGIAKTVKQEITSGDARLTIVLPTGKTNSVVEIKNEETPPVIVGELNQLFTDTSIYTPEDQEAVNNGGAVEIKLTVEKQDAPPEAAKIEAVKKADETVALYLDLTLTKTVTYTNGRETSVEIPEVGTLVETIIPLPMEMQGKGSYTVYRVHNGVAESLPQDKGSEYYKVSSDKTSISVFANRYSVYAIAWSDKAETPPTPPTPPTPSRPTGGGGGSAVRTYTITVEKSEHGKVTANRTNAASGTTVTLTVTPDTGYVPLDLAVTDSQGNSISLTDENTFTMPARAVAVKASFAPVPDENQEKPCDGGLAPRGRPHGRRWRRC